MYGEDPTIFDITPPTIQIDYLLVTKDSFSFKTQYTFWYTIADYGGVKDIVLSKNDIERDRHSYLTRITTVSERTYFETNLETILDALRTARVDMYASDWNGNEENALVYHRPSMYGQMAAELGSDTIYGTGIANDLGLLSGLVASVAEVPELVILIADDPAGFLAGIRDLAGAIISEPTLLADLVSSLPETVKDKQQIENPYAEGTALYDSFAEGWYGGYIASQVALIVVGDGAVKAVKSSEEFAQVTKVVLTKMDDVKATLRASKGLGITEKVSVLLVDDVASVGLDPGVIAKIQTGAKQARAIKLLEDVGESKIRALSGYQDELVELLVRTGDDGVGFIKVFDDATLKKMFSLSIGEVTDRKLLEFRAGLVRMQNIGISDGEIGKYVDDVLKVTDVPNARKFIDDVASTNDIGNFKGLAFEADRAAYYTQITSDIVIEPIEQIDLKVGNKYIELKSSFGSITEDKIERYISSAQGKFGNNMDTVSGNPTKLEISAREGLGSLDTNAIKNEINTVIKKQVIEIPGKQNYINEIEVFLPDGSSIRGIRGDSGLFEWV